MYPLQEHLPAISVLDVGGMDDHVEQQPKGICEDVTLARLDPLSVVFTDLLSIMQALGLASRACNSRANITSR